MNATKPDCASAVTPINAIKRNKIGNIWNLRLAEYNSKIALSVFILNIIFFLILGYFNYKMIVVPSPSKKMSL